MAEDIIDCFAAGPDAELLVAAGHYIGKENIRDFFHHGQKGVEVRKSPNPEFMHQVMQLSGVVHVNPDGLTAQGRWYGFGANAFPAPDNKINPGWMNDVYEVDYIKQDSRWRMKKVHWCMTFHAPWRTSFVPAERLLDEKSDSFTGDSSFRNAVSSSHLCRVSSRRSRRSSSIFLRSLISLFRSGFTSSSLDVLFFANSSRY